MDDVVVEVDGLRRSYGRFEAVRGVSLQVHRGELFALLGLDPVGDRAAVRPWTGVMLQDGGFTGSLTVRETVEIWRSLTARPRPTGEVFRWEPRHR